jgi:hypothetical protein
MAHQRDKWLTAATTAFVFAALTACNRGDDKSSEPKVVELPVPAAAPSAAPSQAQAPTQPAEVKRYGAQEQPLTGSVRVTGESAKAYPEADNKGQPAQELAKSTLVERKASFGDYSLVAYPTPKGDTDLGWVLTSDLASSPEGAVADTSVQKPMQTTAAALAAAKTAAQTVKDTVKTDAKTDTKTDTKKADAKTDTKTDAKTDTKKKADAKAVDADVKKAADAAKKAADAAAKAAADAAAKAGVTTPAAKTGTTSSTTKTTTKKK